MTEMEKKDHCELCLKGMMDRDDSCTLPNCPSLLLLRVEGVVHNLTKDPFFTMTYAQEETHTSSIRLSRDYFHDLMSKECEIE